MRNAATRHAFAVRAWIMRIHRWMGVAFCILFLAWFVSGLVLMYCPFPQVETADRLAHLDALDGARVHVPPALACGILHESTAPARIRLNVLDGRPVYHFEFGARSKLVFADDGRQFDALTQPAALRIAAAWAQLPAAAARFQGFVTDDQWTLDPAIHSRGPFWKYSWPGGEEVYVSQGTGEVAQSTTRSSRLGAYCGAIPHWLYFPLLRRHAGLWRYVVISLACAGAVTSLLGLIAGSWLYSPARRYRSAHGPSHLPFTGPKQWHVFLGLIFGTVTCTWVLSGFMSMSPFHWLAGGDRPDLAEALQGSRLDVAQFAAKDPRQALAEAGTALRVKELELGFFDGQALYLAMETPWRSRLVPILGGAREALDAGRIAAAVKRALAPAAVVETRVVRSYELYYVDRYRQLPLPVLYFRLNDAGQSAYYIDPRTAKVVQSYGKRSRWNRWLYHGLHSMDLPWLYARRPAWDILVILLLLGGMALSTTSLYIAWKLLRRTRYGGY